MKARILHYIILMLSLFLLWSVVKLAYSEWIKNDICPRIIGVPACYIILLCAILVFFSHINVFGKKGLLLYFISAGIPWLIALVGTIQQMSQQIECPKTSTGTPMCYLSFAFFSALILLKIIENRRSLIVK